MFLGATTPIRPKLPDIPEPRSRLESSLSDTPTLLAVPENAGRPGSSLDEADFCRDSVVVSSGTASIAGRNPMADREDVKYKSPTRQIKVHSENSKAKSLIAGPKRSPTKVREETPFRILNHVIEYES